jgi:hypothetical protein
MYFLRYCATDTVSVQLSVCLLVTIAAGCFVLYPFKAHCQAYKSQPSALTLKKL